MPTTYTPPDFGQGPEREPGPACSKCQKPAIKHSVPTSTELEDHFVAAEHYDVCPGDEAVQRHLFPEAFTS